MFSIFFSFESRFNVTTPKKFGSAMKILVKIKNSPLPYFRKPGLVPCVLSLKKKTATETLIQCPLIALEDPRPLSYFRKPCLVVCVLFVKKTQELKC